MPGDPYLSDFDFGAGYGYAPTGAGQTLVTPASTGMASVGGAVGMVAGSSHTSFVVWLLILTLGSIFVLHGLRVGGFTFVFRR